MGGDQDENQSLMDALAALPPSEDENAGFVIAEGDMQAPAEFVNAPLEPMPEGLDAGELPNMEAMGEMPPMGELEEAPSAEDDLDPNLSVDQMLSDAVFEEPAAFTDETLLPLDAASTPSFQLRLDLEKPEQRDKLKALAQAHALTFTESPGSSPMISQLNEYQALAFRQAALAIGVAVRVNVIFPLPTLSEEEQALGDLASVAESSPIVAEGAPSVTLPANEKEVMLLPDNAPGISIVESFGLVTAHRSIARRFFREEEAKEKLEKELQRMPGRNTRQLPSSRLEGLLKDLFLDLQKAALSRGGNAVLGIRLESFPETTNLDPSLEQLRLVAFGTAAVVEKA